MVSSEQIHSPTSPIPKINIKLADNNSNNNINNNNKNNNKNNNNNNNNNNKLMNSQKRSTSRSRSPGPRPKSPSGDNSHKTNNNNNNNNKLMTSPKRTTSRSRSPRPKSPGGKDAASSSRSKSPFSKQHNRADSDNTLANFSSQDVRQNLKSLNPWFGLVTSSSGGGSKNQNNRLSLPPDFDLNHVIRESNERWAKLNLIPMEPKDNSMGNFSKTTSLRVAPITMRPKLAVETFNNIPGSKSMQRTASGPYNGNNNSSPLLTADGFPLIRSRSYNSAVEDVNRSSPAFVKDILPLQHSWTMYYDSKPVMTPGPKTPTGKVSYEENLQTIGTFNNVQLFCRYFNWVKKPSKLAMNTNFHIFKNKIKPMWEDPANANGGKWVISIRHPNLLDRCWTWLVYALVGEDLDEADDICGAVMSRRTRGDRIAVWVRDKDNVPVINGIGKRLLKILDLQNEKGIGMDFQFNEDALKSGTSYNNQAYLSLENLKQELEAAEKLKESNNTTSEDNIKKSENGESSTIDQIASNNDKGEISSNNDKGEISSNNDKGEISSNSDKGEISSNSDKVEISSNSDKVEISSNSDKLEISSNNENDIINNTTNAANTSSNTTNSISNNNNTVAGETATSDKNNNIDDTIGDDKPKEPTS